MASFQGTSRTNYVTVDDLDGLRKALEPWPIEVQESDRTPGVVALFDRADSGWPSLSTDENGEDIELDVATTIMPFVREGELLVLMEVGHEGRRYLHGSSDAWVRQGEQVRHTRLELNDIYQQAARDFGLDQSAIRYAEY